MTAAPQPQANIEGIIHDLRASGDPTEEIWAYEIDSLRTRIAELEANEKAYEEIIGKKTFQEVADRIREMEEALQLLDLLLDFSDDNVDPVWTFEDTTSIQTAFARAYAALQPKDIAP
jgi:hypothetical protein